MGKHPIDHDHHRDAKVAREYARVDREQADPITDPKVRAMGKAAGKGEAVREAEKFAQIERETADKLTDPKVRAMTRAAHKGEPETNETRLKKFLKIDRQKPQP